MGTAERKEREKLQRYNAILDAAEEEFFEKGLHQATVEDIAKRADLSKGTIYLYFKSKELIYLGINIRATSILRNKFIEAVSRSESGLDQTLEIGKAYYRFSLDYPHYFRVISFVDSMNMQDIDRIMEDPIAREAHDVGQSVLQVLAEAVERGISDGSIRSDADPMKIAVLLWAQSNGVINLEKSRDQHVKTHDLDLGQLYDQFLLFARRSLENRNEIK